MQVSVLVGKNTKGNKWEGLLEVVIGITMTSRTNEEINKKDKSIILVVPYIWG